MPRQEKPQRVIKDIYPSLPNFEDSKNSSSQIPKRKTFIIITDEDKSNYTLSRFADIYPFRDSITKQPREVKIDNIKEIIDNQIQDGELLFFPELGLALSYHDESEMDFNKNIDNGLEMVFCSAIRSVYENDENSNMFGHNSNPVDPSPLPYFTSDRIKPRLLDAAKEQFSDGTSSNLFDRMDRASTINLDPLETNFFNKKYFTEVDRSSIKTTDYVEKVRSKKKINKLLLKKDVNWGLERIKTRKTKYTGEGVNIGILDTGIDLSHQDFKSKKISYFSIISEDVSDAYGHGTHCASIATGKNGVAPNANLIVGKVLDKEGKGDETNLLLGIYECLRQGADVILFSIQLENGNRGLRRDPLDEIIKLAIEEYDCHVVCAAGNDSNRPYTLNRICSPADSQYALAVSAIDTKDNFYKRSNRAKTFQTMNFTAPGVDILAAQSQQTIHGSLPLYSEMSGTSMAVPFIGGTIALIINKITEIYGSEYLAFDLIINELINICEKNENWETTDAGDGIPNIDKL